MHVGIVAAPSRKEDVRSIMRSLSRHAVNARGITIADTWVADDAGRFGELLRESTHLVVLPEPGPIADWAVYVLGFAEGGSRPVCVLAGSELPPVFSQIAVVELSRMEDYLISERSIWERAHRVETARARLRGTEGNPGAFCKAALEADRRMVDDFLTVGHPANTRSPEGVPVVVCAVRGRSVEIVQRLLSEGGDPNARCGSDGANALCEASSLGLGEIVGVLLASGADPNQETGSGQTALMLAASQGRAEAVERLISSGADPSGRDSLGMSALDYARLFERQEIMGILERVNRS